MRFDLSKNARIIINKNKVILANIINGKWIRISKEVYDILNYAINKKMDLNILTEALSDEEDVAFMDNLYRELCSIGVVVEENKEQILHNNTVSFEMTHRCNLNCIHCCIDADGVISEKKDLSTEEVKSIFHKLIDWNPRSIMLSGGECMLRTDFLELLTYLKNNYKGEIIVATNGTLINKENVSVLARCAHQIDISLDGVDEESCAIVRGKGVFNKVLQSVRLLQDTGFTNITISMAVADKNEYLKENFKRLNTSLGTRPIIRRFSPHGRGKDNQKTFSNKSKSEIYIPKDFLIDKYGERFGVCTCSAGKRELFIAYNGDIYPCPSFIRNECMLGNILEIDNLNSLTKDSNDYSQVCKSVEILDPKNSVYCKNCNVNLFCWTCPGSGEEFNTENIKYHCKIIKPILTKRVWGME